MLVLTSFLEAHIEKGARTSATLCAVRIIPRNEMFGTPEVGAEESLLEIFALLHKEQSAIGLQARPSTVLTFKTNLATQMC